MIIKLFQPLTRNWLLIAEQLDDPPMWDRFLPCHAADSERSTFELTVKQLAGNTLSMTSYKDMLKCGVSVFEYNWDAKEDEILSHAMLVAESLGQELLMDAPAIAV